MSFVSFFRDSAMDEGFAASGSLHDFFAHKVRQNVHVALLMNIGHPNFASRIQSNPSLYKHCSIVSFTSFFNFLEFIKFSFIKIGLNFFLE